MTAEELAARSSFTPEELAAFLRAESAKWGQVVRQAGIRVE